MTALPEVTSEWLWALARGGLPDDGKGLASAVLSSLRQRRFLDLHDKLSTDESSRTLYEIWRLEMAGKTEEARTHYQERKAKGIALPNWD